MSRAPDVVAFGSGLIDAPNRVCKAAPDRMQETILFEMAVVELFNGINKFLDGLQIELGVRTR